ncbi:hypothetical protein Bpfe_017831 [Biomphalaria pfeifferi]|uniref:Uncharacterized protein n=1 Tax=Biomphalaria pfeifferi TaxID=112525 RepID=A0AAD8F629_BIOPF|nr:hypothetical protein Bpfe_017831 [Biomphalaria pfeifferi]
MWTVAIFVESQEVEGLRLCLLSGCHHARPLCHGHILRQQRIKKRTFQVLTKKLSHIKKMAKKITAPLSPKVSKGLFLRSSGETCQTRLENGSTINILKTLLEVKYQGISLSEQVVGLEDKVQQLEDFLID